MKDMKIPDLQWLAVYNDEAKLLQNYGKGIEGKESTFKDIDQTKLKKLFLVGGQLNENLMRSLFIDVEEQLISIFGVKFYIEFPRDKEGNKVKGKLVYFRRVKKDFTPDKGIITIVRHCIGLQANIDGVNHQQYLFINEDGTFTLSQKK